MGPVTEVEAAEWAAVCRNTIAGVIVIAKAVRHQPSP
jgi:hypothetical protein